MYFEYLVKMHWSAAGVERYFEGYITAPDARRALRTALLGVANLKGKKVIFKQVGKSRKFEVRLVGSREVIACCENAKVFRLEDEEDDDCWIDYDDKGGKN